MSRVTGRNTRPKKLTPKQNVPIFREEQVESASNLEDAIRNQVETGVEKSEESEYHLQQAIKASQADRKIKDAYIPTPPTIASDIKYDHLYPKRWQQPNTYIRSSETVEDCNLISYCMDEDDEVALKVINAKSGLTPMTEDQFEEVMTFFEETVSIEQPYASLGSTPVMSLDELLRYATDSTPATVQTYSKAIYEHWAMRRAAKHNAGLPPQLKFESGKADVDDIDPYVCFRRREVRQTRKTRGRDQQAADKLRKLRIELESARALLTAVKRREETRREALETDRHVFEQRQSFRELKRKLKQSGDNELLINQKKPKVAPIVPTAEVPPQALARPQPELKTIEDLRAERARAIENEIQANVEKHIRWNDGYVDKTTFPLSPEPDFDDSPQFLPAMPAEYLPTPPASVSEDESGDKDVEMKDTSRPPTPFRYASPDEDHERPPMPAFRRRIGRGGRVLVDRKFPVRSRVTDDRFKYDRDSDDDDEDIFGDSFSDMTTRQSNERSLLLHNAMRDAQQATQRRLEQANVSPSQIQAQAQAQAQAQIQPQPQPAVVGAAGGGSNSVS